MVARPNSSQVVTEMREAAEALLVTLDGAQRGKLCFPIEDEATRTDWGYFPRRFHGLPIGSLDQRQHKLVHRLVASALSLPAYARVTTIMALENVLDVIEGRSRSHERDPGWYFLSWFGRPADGWWCWQFEGHHVSLNVTAGPDGVVSATPLFLGSNPADVEGVGQGVLRPLGPEEDLGRALVGSLSDEQRRVAVLSEVAPPDILLMNAASVPERVLPGDIAANANAAERFAEMPGDAVQALALERDEPRGVPAADLDPDQVQLFRALLSTYTDRLPYPVAGQMRARMQAAGDGGPRFAWAGGLAMRERHYYRIHGAGVLVEYDNTQDGANHIHAVLREPARDFGGDPLRSHLAAGHGVAAS